jgi:hypothetical protein
MHRRKPNLLQHDQLSVSHMRARGRLPHFLHAVLLVLLLGRLSPTLLRVHVSGRVLPLLHKRSTVL